MEFAGIEVKPNNSVKNIVTTPRQPIIPRISRTGLIGRLSASIGFGIDAPLLSQTCRRAQAFNSTNDGFPAVKFCSTAAQAVRPDPPQPLTSWPHTRKLGYEHQEHLLASIRWFRHVRIDGSGKPTAAGGR